MKLRQLKYVLAIADSGLNMTTAASRVYTSQPGVSKQVKSLEEELGVQLFVRKGRSLAGTTAAGDELLRRARMIMREIDGIRSLCAELADDGKRGEGARFGRATVRSGWEPRPPGSRPHSANPRSHCSMPPDPGRAGYARIADARTSGRTPGTRRGRAGGS